VNRQPGAERRRWLRDFHDDPWCGWIGVLGAIWAFNEIRTKRMEFDFNANAVFLVFSTAVPMLIWHALRWWGRDSDLSFQRFWSRISPIRVLVKLWGMLVLVAVTAFAYWCLPEYRDGFYLEFYAGVYWVVKNWGWIIPLYVVVADGLLDEPEDAWWHWGRYLTGGGMEGKKAIIANLLRGWLVKAFFLPLMFVYLVNLLPDLLHPAIRLDTFGQIYRHLTNFLLLFDLVFVAVGYLCTLRIFRAHIRSAEPTLQGWLAALICYQPIWSLIEVKYMSYYAGFQAADAVDNMGVWGIVLGVTILIFQAIFSWCTICFGLRFSNLTNRGLIHFGPYAWCRHPAYISKLFAFALMHLPFLPAMWIDPANAEEAAPWLQRLVLFGGLCAVYWWRARTEENHLRSTGSYRIYERWLRRRQTRCWRSLRGRIGLGRAIATVPRQ
jgi:uncharacterized membrane protein (DUF485 family)